MTDIGDQLELVILCTVQGVMTTPTVVDRMNKEHFPPLARLVGTDRESEIQRADPTLSTATRLTRLRRSPFRIELVAFW
jgi:hypothetical protein